MNTPGERFDRAETGQPYKPQSRMYSPLDIAVTPQWNVRDMTTTETHEYIADLKASILARGVDKPIAVRYDRKTGIKTLVDGQCRLTACKELWQEGHKVYIPCVQVEGDEAELTAESLTSNSGHPLTQLEIGVGCKRLLKWGWSPAVIAAHICKPLRFVTDALALADVPLEAKALLNEGAVTPGAVLHAVSGKDGDSVEALKTRVAERPADPAPRQATLPGTPAKAKKPKPVARPKKPSAKEQIAKSAPECLKLADKMYYLILDNDAHVKDQVAAAKAYGKARGL
jgi:ParB/RepB/Spo0J family partition protein